MMATNTDEDDLVKCPICFEKYTNPKYLPCLHTFCHLCLKSYIVSKLGEGQKSNPFPCPVCRQIVEVPNPNVFSENIADVMPGNHLITALIERTQSLNKGKDERTCDPCNLDNQNIPAYTWCTKCFEALCENCTSYHKRLKQTRNHLTVPIDDAFKQQQTAQLDIDEPCMEHSGKMLEVYCLDHKQMCCVICMATKHRKCENISTFEEMVTWEKDGELIEYFTKHLLEIDENTEILRIKTQENINLLELKHAEMTEKVSSIVEMAIDKLTNLKNKFLSQVKQIHKEQNVQLVERKERIETFQNGVKKGYKMLQKIREQGSPKQVFITREKIKKQIENHLEFLKEDFKNCKDVDYVLFVDDILSAVVHSLTSVADVQLTSSSDMSENLNAVISVFTNLSPKTAAVDIMDLEVVTLTRLASIKGDITGGTFLPDGKSVFCDYTNRKLKVYDKSGIHLFDTLLEKKPWDVIFVRDNRIVVSFDDQSHLTMYEVKQNEFKEISTIPCKQGPEGIAVFNDNIVVAYNTCIDLITLKGECLNSISRSHLARCYVVALKSGSLCHNEGESIVSRFMDGWESFRYADSKLNYPAGIALDCYENVFVCGYGTGNVHVLSRDGKKHSILMKNLIKPFAVGFDNDGMKFFLSTIGDTASLGFYRLSVKKSEK